MAIPPSLDAKGVIEQGVKRSQTLGDGRGKKLLKKRGRYLSMQAGSLFTEGISDHYPSLLWK